MCGIFGWVLGRAEAKDRDTLVRLTDLLTHRGPDGAGYWLGETPDGNHQVGLGHRRLSIIDIAGGAQPMASADGRYLITYNGEIYNYIELRADLESRGHRFVSRSDTEVILEAFRAWDTGAFPRLRGMFALALYDTLTGRLVLARDPFGKKPLFLAGRDGALIFASEMEPLVRSPGFDRAFNHAALDHYLLNRYVPGPLTLFSAATKLQPGHYAVFERGRLDTVRYFEPPLATTEPEVGSLPEAVSLFREALDDAVRIRLRSEAPYGAYLSGGIDSSAIVATMARHMSSPVRTFSVGFEEERYSELAPARLVAEHFGTDHHELVVTPADFMAHWPEAVLHRGAPVSQTSDIPILLLSRMARDSVKMVLTGEGSDEFMGGYPKHRAEPLVAAYQRLVPAALHTGLVEPLVRALPYGMRRVKIVAAAAAARNHADRMRVWFGDISPAQAAAMLGRPVDPTPPDAYPFSLRSRSSLRRILFFDQTSWLPDNLLERGDRMMMAGSIEGRMPFMDTELAAVVARFPDRFLTGGKGGKTVLRAAMAETLPAAILGRKKVGFAVPFGDWCRGPYREMVTDLLAGPGSTVAGLCRRDGLTALVAEHMGGRQNHERTIWSLANLELFLRTFKPTGL
jgi:asparagine synthase (glutamine-hydrolysing)